MVALKSTYLVTGAAGFIGAALVRRLLLEGINVVGIDNLNSYYDLNLKKARLNIIDELSKSLTNAWTFHQATITDYDSLKRIAEANPSINVVINLAAQAGVRYSLINPYSYTQSNLVGFSNILELSKELSVDHFIYASSSSIYGGNTNFPYVESQAVNHPISFYAATKKSNELMAHSYSHLFKIPTTGLRLFTVYGPWGRPDMAPMIFAKAILSSEPIKIFNHGQMKRDFTYIEDVSESIFRCSLKPATPNSAFDSSIPDPSTSFAPYRIFNVGNSNPIDLLTFIQIMEENLGVKAIKEFHDIQPGDVPATAADTNSIYNWIDYRPLTSIEEGVKSFTKWFRDFYHI